MRFTLTDTFCIHHADLELNKITVLMGDNGCGKTICTVLLGNGFSGSPFGSNVASVSPHTWGAD